MDNRLAAAGIILAAFLAGGVSGGVLVHTLTEPEDRWERGDRDARWKSDRDRRDRRGERPRSPRSFTTRSAVDRLARRLDLTRTQKDSVRAIMERQRDSASAIFEDVGPQLRGLLDTTNARVRRVLDPDQQETFDRMVEEERGVLGRRSREPGDTAGSGGGG